MAIGSATSTSKVSSTSRTGKARKTKKTGQAKRKRRTQGTRTADKTKISRESKAAQQAGNTTHTNALAQNFGTAKAGKPDPMAPKAGGPTGVHQSKGTGYYPSNSKMEGGFNDRKGNKLATLQDFLEGKSKYVSVAMDKNQKIPYGKNLNIKELDAKYKDQLKAMGKEHIDFRVTDTGGAFTNKGTGRLDIATRDRKASLDPTINGPLTLDFGK